MASSSPPEGNGTPPSGRRPETRRSLSAVVAIALVIALVLGVGATAIFLISEDGAQPAPSPTPDAMATDDETPAATPPPDTAEPEPPAGASEAGANLRDITYCRNDGVDLQLDFLRPPVAGTTPLLLFVHGGGWSRGDKGQVGRLDFLDSLLESGYSVASANYRLSPDYPFPAPIVDVKCAVRHLRANAASYGIDPDRIAVSGFSAGAHLAMLVGVTDSTAGFDVGQYGGVSSAVSAVVEFDGQADMTELRDLHPDIARTTFAGSLDVLTAASPVTYLDAEDPPFLIFHGELDRTVPVAQAELLGERLEDLGIENSVIIVPGGAHQVPEGPDYTAAILEFLDRHLG